MDTPDIILIIVVVIVSIAMAVLIIYLVRNPDKYKKTGGGSNTFGIFSANIHRGGLYDGEDTRKILPLIKRYNPDLVCFQEAISSMDPRYESFKRMLLRKYGYEEIIQEPKIPCTSECLQCFLKIDSNYTARAQDIKVSDNCNTEGRYQQLITMINKSTGNTFKVGNVHLCGGKFDDQNMSELSIREIREIRIKSIGTLIQLGAICIAGDTNTDLNIAYNRASAKDAFESGYTQSLRVNREQFINWNKSTVDILQNNGFKEAFFDSQSGKLEKTSSHGVRVDGIWYKDPLEIRYSETINLINHPEPISDHNALYVDFNIRDIQQQPSYYDNKLQYGYS